MARLRNLIIALFISSLPLMTGCGGSVSANSTRPLVLMTASLPPAVVGTPYTAALQATGGVPPYTFSIGGSVPAGLTLSGSTITGTPTQAGSTSLIVQVTDAASHAASGTLSIAVSASLEIVTSAVPDGTLGRPYSAQLVASGGISPYSWRLPSGILPPGLSLSSSGLISGTPSAQADDSVEIEVTDSSVTTSGANGGTGGSGSNSKSKGIKVRTLKPLAITTTSMPAATVGSAYSKTLQATGGLTPYTWAITAGQLPPGLALNVNTGTISGTPSAAGAFNFTAGVTDSASPSSSAAGPLTLAANATPVQLTVTTTSLPDATVDTAYTVTVQAAGGTPPYGWSLSSGSLPTGLTLDPGTGTLSGTPSSAGDFTVGLHVQDSTGASAMANLPLRIAAVALAILTTTLPDGTVGMPYDAILSASGGTPPYTWNITSGALPSSMALSATTGEINGTPSTDGTFSLTAEVADATQQTASKPLSLTVATTAPLDQYGGFISTVCAGGVKPNFYTEKIGNQWWFCTPAGHGFFSQGLYLVDYAMVDRTDPQGVNGKTVALAKYNGSGELWADATLQRIRSWGFNTTVIVSSLNLWPMTTYSSWPADAWGAHTIPTKQPFVLMTRPGLNSMKNSEGYLSEPVKDMFFAMPAAYNSMSPINYRGHPVADWFDPKVLTWFQADMAKNPTYSFVKNSHYADYLLGVVCEDADNTWGFNAGDAFSTNPVGNENVHLGWAVAVMSPKVSATSPNLTAKALSDTTVYVKKSWHDYLVNKYSTIGALNTAWGSNYTTFDSSGIPVIAESIATGTGSQVSFTKTLVHANVSPYTIVVKVNGMAVGGDCPKWTWQCGSPAHDASFTGGAPILAATGDVTYSSGTVTVVFSSAPASGAAITVDYVYNGWSYGTGLMDEDGRSSHTWLGTNDSSLANANANFKADADAFLGQIAEHTLGTVCHDTIKAAGNFPNALHFGPDSLFTWSVPSRGPVINAASKYLDAFITSDVWPMTQDMMNYVAANSTREVPIIAGYYRSANADSPMNQLADGIYRGTGSHAQKGQEYYDYVTAYRALAYPSGSYPLVGVNIWAYYDMWGEQTTWGLVTHRDNAYDGHEAITGSVACSAPLQTKTCGGEDSTAATYPSWQANHTYVWNLYASQSNNRILETVGGTPYIFEATYQSLSDWTRSGTSAGTKCSPAGSPTCFPTTYGATFTDGTVIWRNVGAKTNPNGYGDMITKVKDANGLWKK